MKVTQIKETCLYISDLDKAEHFYGNTLGFPVIAKVEGRHIFFRCGTAVLLCFIPEATKAEATLPPHFATGKQHIAFEVTKEDYSKTKEQLLQKGINIRHEQEWKGGLKSFYFDDPFGHLLEVVPKGIWEG
ncbi:MAG TPA: VOC family protein [Cyclobacteriaceae bacterium]|nr:VOC family protein [Cyclobacteriaceae bacterium]